MSNCTSCRHLEWHDDDSSHGADSSGYGCNKRDEGGANVGLLARLQDRIYLGRPNRCFDAKDAAPAASHDTLKEEKEHG